MNSAKVPGNRIVFSESRISLHNWHQRGKKKFPFDEGHPFNQNTNPGVNFLNTFEPQGRMLQIQITYISYIWD